ncbi:cilia- and flagella-associated protein 20-like isoform X1 [Teleopsis dalmanni]|uniref:cilia- and flagella-associated protein 20-like isoform X1 n=1 Tax=Teleopsis dalmanni TaxID=139649 RepID=UPI000D32A795|nr:cilia- and flagella-associated protein 20-like isoform X1 [Teleopsis dalmanni]
MAGCDQFYFPRARVFSLLNSIDKRPIWFWGIHKWTDGCVKRITDMELQTLVLQITGSCIDRTFICCPPWTNRYLFIDFPVITMLIKNLKQYFVFEWTIIDDEDKIRRFRASNFCSVARVSPTLCLVPMRLVDGWNRIRFDQSSFAQNAYGTNFRQTIRLQIHANCQIRYLYLSNRFLAEDELPPDLQLHLKEPEIEIERQSQIGSSDTEISTSTLCMEI